MTGALKGYYWSVNGDKLFGKEMTLGTSSHPPQEGKTCTQIFYYNVKLIMAQPIRNLKGLLCKLWFNYLTDHKAASPATLQRVRALGPAITATRILVPSVPVKAVKPYWTWYWQRKPVSSSASAHILEFHVLLLYDGESKSFPEWLPITPLRSE